MANIEITDNTIIRSLIRKGTDADRRKVTLEQGELGYTTDTNRVFVGDGINLGGSVIGSRFLGKFNSFGDSINSGIQPGDTLIINKSYYARNVDGSGNVNDASGYTTLGFNGGIGAGLTLNSSSNIDVNVDNNTIFINSQNQLYVKDLSYASLPNIDGNSIIGNASPSSAGVTGIRVLENSLIGRIGEGNLSNIQFGQVLSNAQNPSVASLSVEDLKGTGTRQVFVNTDGRLTQDAANLAGSFASNTLYFPHQRIKDYYPGLDVATNGANSQFRVPRVSNQIYNENIGVIGYYITRYTYGEDVSIWNPYQRVNPTAGQGPLIWLWYGFLQWDLEPHITAGLNAAGLSNLFPTGLPKIKNAIISIYSNSPDERISFSPIDNKAYRFYTSSSSFNCNAIPVNQYNGGGPYPNYGNNIPGYADLNVKRTFHAAWYSTERGYFGNNITVPMSGVDNNLRTQFLRAQNSIPNAQLANNIGANNFDKISLDCIAMDLVGIQF